MEKNANSNLIYLREIFSIPEKVPAPKVDWIVQEIERQQRDLIAIFDKEVMKAEVKEIFAYFKKESISHHDLDYSQPEYWGDRFCDYSRRFIDINSWAGDKVLSDILEEIDLDWDRYFFARMYDYLLQNQKAELTEEQRNKVINYCNIISGIKTFSKGITNNSRYDFNLDLELIHLSFFIRRLDLTKYSKELYLDMLCFIKHNDAEIDIFDFVQDVPGITYQDMKDRVVENLREGIINFRSLENHLKFIEKNNIHESCPYLLNYLKNDQTVDREEILKLYLKLVGDLTLLEILLPASHNFERFLIIKLIESNAPFIRTYIKNEFKTETSPERKLFLAKQLIGFQDLKAFSYYLEVIRKNKNVHDDSSPNNPFFAITDASFTMPVLEMLKLSQDPSIVRETFRNLESISYSCLRNIYLHQNNYKRVEARIGFWIGLEKMRNIFGNQKEQKLINLIRAYLEVIRQQYYVSKSKVFNIDQALDLLEEVT